MRWWVVVWLAAGCGRIGFALTGGDGGVAGDLVGGDGGAGRIQAQQAYLKASNTRANTSFGFSVALSGDAQTLAVGAFGETSGATGIDGDQGDTSADHAGAVYVFARAGASWVQQAYVKASNTDSGDDFGRKVALSGDGNVLAVAAPFEASAATGVGGNQADNSAAGAGAVYLFTRSGTTWTQRAYVKASNAEAGDNFGTDVALSADGTTLAVGTPLEASAATGIGGNQADNSAAAAGAVYVFSIGTTVAPQAYVKASNTEAGDNFGYAVSLSADGNTLAAGAVDEASAATGVGGNQADNSAPYSGAVYVFSRAGATWSQQAYVKASNTGRGDQLGWDVSLAADGSTLAMGALDESSAATGVGGDQADDSAPSAGAVYVLTRSGTTWSQAAYVKATNTEQNDELGFHVRLSGDGQTLAAGTYIEASAATGLDGDQADNSAPLAGAVYLYARSGATWLPYAYVKSSNAEAGDSFSAGMSLAGGAVLAVGAPDEDSSATGVAGDQADNATTDSGAVYLFE